MTDIFISYAKEDKAVTEALAALFEEQGWSVWWDRDIPLGREYDRVIEEALVSAKCVVVLWSQVSTDSDWVRSEAEEAHRHGTIIPALIDDVLPPLAFRRIQAADLTRWKGESDSPEILQILGQVATLLSRAKPAPPQRDRKTRRTKPRKIRRLARVVVARKPHYLWITLGGVTASLVALTVIWWRLGLELPDTAPSDVVERAPRAVLTEETKARLDTLLELGESHLEIGFLIEPPGSNAYESFEQALRLDPGNPRAKAGIRRIGDKIVVLATQTRDRGDIARSTDLIEEGLRRLPDHAGLLALKRSVDSDRVSTQR